MKNTHLSAIATEILVHALDDWVHAPELHAIAQKHRWNADDARVLADVLGALRELVNAGLISLGTVTASGFEKSEETDSVLFGRLEREWRALGRPSVPGEVCWVSLTALGRSEAERIARPEGRG